MIQQVTLLPTGLSTLKNREKKAYQGGGRLEGHNLTYFYICMRGWRSSRSAFSPYKRHYTYFFPSVVYFSHRRSARIKKLIDGNLTGALKTLGVHTFPHPIGQFGAPLQPFWIFRFSQKAVQLASAPGAVRLVYFLHVS